MRLKKLEMIGFKSFATKIKLEFDQGITAIVGPNGSGKSNISDAVRWVLGEQSIKSLRGSKLEDVIFVGSNSKRPLGMCEVQLTLDNSDGFLPIEFNEVTITRRVYRSGDSEFLINRQSCRLRDIQDLFTDTGLGREGYSIIGQGQIDAVLSASSDDRRVLLEDTAGIVKYRHRKEEAKRKIDRTDQDLVRVSDILSELREQLGPLEEQAKKARQYQNWASELETNELDIMALDFKRLLSLQDQFEINLRDERVVGEQLSRQYKEQEELLNNTKLEINKIELQLDYHQNEVSTLSDQINSCMQSISLAEERILNNTQQQEQRNQQATDLKSEIADYQHQISKITDQLEHQERNYQQAADELKAMELTVDEFRVNYQKRRDELENQKDNFIEFIRTLADARNFQRNFQQQTKSADHQIKNIEAEHRELVANYEDAAKEIEKIRQTKTDLTNQKLKISDQSGQLKAHIGKKIDHINRLIDEEKRAYNRLQQLQSRLQALQDLEVEYEGYNYSVRKLMQANVANVELLGTVADVIRVPAGLETAFEVALGAGLQNVITETERDAKLAIEWLKLERAGRATFLPLNNIKGRTFPKEYEQYWHSDKCLGPAVNLLEFEERFFPAIASLLGRVAVVEDLDAALDLQRKLPNFSRIVTCSGEVVMPSGSLTGGSINRKSGGLLARKNEIEQLQHDLRQQEGITDELTTAKVAAEQELDKYKQTLANIQKNDYQLQLELQSIDNELHKLNDDQDRTNRLCDTKLQQLHEYQTELSELIDQAAASQDNIVELEKEENNKRSMISRLELEIQNLENNVTQVNEKLTQHKIELTSKSAGLTQLKDKKQSVEYQLKRSEEQLEISVNETNQLKEKYNLLITEINDNKQQYDSLQHFKVVALDKLQKYKGAKATLQQEVDHANIKFKELQTSLSRIDKKIYNIQLELDRVKLEFRQIDEKLNEREVVPEQLQSRTVTADPQFIKANIRNLKGKIRDLGVINLGSLVEYESVKDRVMFLEKQLNDLIKAKETLHEVVSEIDATSSERFLATYKSLRREFQIMFSKLFKGGNADIILTDPENVLSTGVDIIAQPPGKKQQILSLLSGGERSLTAIALLLAIRKVKPTPFCILDEIDAALDDTNLARFAEQMKEFSASTQFLVITHRQGTMEIADRLYGVTMAEDAVSQLISVQLSEIEE